MTMFETLFSLAGKVAVVTDCEGELRAPVARMLADAGATVVIADRDADAIGQFAREIDPRGERAIPICTDIEAESEVVALFDAVRQRCDRLDILVNCAGVTSVQPLTETTSAQWDELHSINLRATFLCMREAVRSMLEAGNGGRIVNCTTVGATHPVLNGNEAYTSSRAGVTMLTKTTALDYARKGITANVLMPAFILGHARILDETLERMRQDPNALTGPGRDEERRLLLGFGDIRDIATAVLYLVGPSGGFITGQTLIMDGGYSVS